MESGLEGWVEALAMAQVTEEESLMHIGLSMSIGGMNECQPGLVERREGGGFRNMKDTQV